jgi:hypothetical protein
MAGPQAQLLAVDKMSLMDSIVSFPLKVLIKLPGKFRFVEKKSFMNELDPLVYVP